MQMLILAGGLGTRLRPLTERLPKCMVPANGKPFLEHQLRLLASRGVRDIVLCVGHLGERVLEYFGNGHRFGVSLTYAWERNGLLGTAGAIRLAVDSGLMEERFFVLYGDSYLDLDLRAMARAAEGDARPLLAVYRNDGLWDASNAQVEMGMVTRFAKGLRDPRAAGLRYIDYGIALLPRVLIAAEVPAGGRRDLSEVYAGLAAAGRLRAFEANERFHEIGSPDGLRALEARLAGKSGAKAR